MKVQFKGDLHPISALLAGLLLLWIVLLVALIDSWPIFGLTTGRRFQFFGTGHIVRHAVTTTSRSFGSRRFRMQAGDELSLDYAVDVEEGSVYLSVMRVQRFPVKVETIWHETVKNTDEDETTIPVPQPGRYKITVKLGHFQGDVDVRWRRLKGDSDIVE
jgi:hypothetical protein